jgi:hypothetical protein
MAVTVRGPVSPESATITSARASGSSMLGMCPMPAKNAQAARMPVSKPARNRRIG